MPFRAIIGTGKKNFLKHFLQSVFLCNSSDQTIIFFRYINICWALERCWNPRLSGSQQMLHRKSCLIPILNHDSKIKKSLCISPGYVLYIKRGREKQSTMFAFLPKPLPLGKYCDLFERKRSTNITVNTPINHSHAKPQSIPNLVNYFLWNVFM